MIGAMAFAAVAAGKTSKDPNAFASYGAGMASDKQYPMAVEWHNTNRVALDAKGRRGIYNNRILCYVP